MSLENCHLRENKVEEGWHVVKHSSRKSLKANYHIFRVEDSQFGKVKSLCSRLEYRKVSNKCIKKQVEDPVEFVGAENKICSACLKNYKSFKNCLG